MQKNNITTVRLKLYPKKFDKVKEFYKDILGFAIQKEWNRAPNDRGVMFAVGSATIELLSPQDMYLPVQGCGVSLEVSDVDKLWQELKTQESITFSLRDNSWGDTSFGICDPEGFEITFFTKHQVKVEEVSLDEALKIHKTIIEFDKPYAKEVFEERLKGKQHLILVAYYKETPAGYVVGYEQETSWYCWMAGVDPNHRKKGVLKALMQYQQSWAKENGYTKITIKTWNKHRNMLAYLVKYGFNIVDVEQKQHIQENRIYLEKSLT